MQSMNKRQRFKALAKMLNYFPRFASVYATSNATIYYVHHNTITKFFPTNNVLTTPEIMNAKQNMQNKT